MPNPFAQPAYSAHYPRDLVGYGAQPPQANWPGKAKIALQFVLNYEEGAENTVLDGDAGSERFLSEIVGAESYPARHMSMESIYEYGSRAGAWRILREFERRKLPLTVFGVTLALKRHPELKNQYAKTLALLEMNPHHPSLRLHALSGRLQGVHSVSINLSYRIKLELLIQDQQIIPLNVGDHDAVY